MIFWSKDHARSPLRTTRGIVNNRSLSELHSVGRCAPRLHASHPLVPRSWEFTKPAWAV